MKEIILIGIGGGVGAICRFLLSRTLHLFTGFTFPYGTLVVNVLGSFLMALLSVIIIDRIAVWSTELRALLLIGLLGGFTTFSTFSYEVVDLWENGEGVKMAFYLLLSILLCIGGAFGGLILGRKL
ncbi:MAG: fluoride efflux transporter CrcB [Simkaniaceae bacterium]|jgi:CrcB protein|nr:MAG: fluoride efflux transporter CrcB [Simkaniaceae bacterium]